MNEKKEIKQLNNTKSRPALRLLLRCMHALLICGATLSGCSKDMAEEPVATQHVLLAYLGGDNDLSGESYAKLESLGRGWDARQGGRLLVYHDPADAPPQLLELCRCDKGKPYTKVIRRYEEDNSADGAVFASVIDEVRRLYPSAGYGLLVFSHATGWLPGGALSDPKSGAKSVLSDGSDRMALADFAAAIPDGAFDYIVFEACFMAGIEVAYQLKDKAAYILASGAEIVSPGFTDVYPQAVNDLFEGEPGLRAFAGKAFGYFDGQSGYMRSATLSVIKTQELEALAAFIRENATRDAAADISGIQHFDRYPAYRLFFDFGDYYGGLLADDQQRQELHHLVDKAVVWKASTAEFMPGYNGFVIARHSGLTTYIPQDRFPFLNGEYEKLAWSRAICKRAY